MHRYLIIASLALVGCPSKATYTGEPSEADRFPRLTHTQWERTVQDLFVLGDPPGLATQFQPDPQLGRFDNNIARLATSAALWRDYQHAAEVMSERVAHDPGTLAVIVPADSPGDPRAFVESFGLHTFRRPLNAGEADRYMALFAMGAARFPEHDAFTAGVRLVIEAMLQSPHFLYRAELAESVVDGGMPLTGYEVASRLSYVLWNTMPDETLLTAARKGELDSADGVRKHAARMFDDPRTLAQFRRFHFQAFAMSEYGDLDKDPVRFPQWRRDLGVMMQEEALRFLDDVVANDGGVAEILTSTKAFVNADLAAVYQVPGDFGADFTEVKLDPQRRAGFLTRAGFLARNATLAESDPIHRGVFVNLNLICRTISARPDIPDSLMPMGNTTRERVDSITGNDTCGQGCHARMINPIGFALEHFDAIGAYREDENGFAINSADTYAFEDGREIKFANAVELSKQLAKAPEVHSCYVSQLLEFTLGRTLLESDQPSIDDFADRSLSDGASVRDVVLSVVASRAFRARAIPRGAP
jgi:hypothetical protein